MTRLHATCLITLRPVSTVRRFLSLAAGHVMVHGIGHLLFMSRVKQTYAQAVSRLLGTCPGNETFLPMMPAAPNYSLLCHSGVMLAGVCYTDSKSCRVMKQVHLMGDLHEAGQGPPLVLGPEHLPHRHCCTGLQPSHQRCRQQTASTGSASGSGAGLESGSSACNSTALVILFTA